jgi:hypothetical protein
VLEGLSAKEIEELKAVLRRLEDSAARILERG